MKYLMLLLGISLLACNNAPEATTTADGTFHGEPFTVEKPISIKKLVANLAENDELTTSLKGTVTSVCQKKGCWMTLNEEGTEEEVFVKFKDYGFFVPLDLTGEVIIHGKGFKTMTPVDELRHYAEDQGKSQEEIDAITEPKEEYQFEAIGVKVI